MKLHHAIPLLLLILCAGCLPTPAEPSVDKQPTTPAETGDPSLDASETERVVAKPGVGKSSKNLGQFDSGTQKMIASPAQAFFKTKEKIVFEIQIKQAVNLYRATSGDFPKTEEEFMEKIIKFNRIELPELPKGHKYVYEPKDGQLYVERPVE